MISIVYVLGAVASVSISHHYVSIFINLFFKLPNSPMKAYKKNKVWELYTFYPTDRLLALPMERIKQ